MEDFSLFKFELVKADMILTVFSLSLDLVLKLFYSDFSWNYG